MPSFEDANFHLYNQADPSKKIAFNCGTLTTGTEATIALPPGVGGANNITMGIVETVNTWIDQQIFSDENAIGDSPIKSKLADPAGQPVWYKVEDVANGHVLELTTPALTADRIQSVQDASGTVPLVVATSNNASQTANIGSTTIYTTTTAGMHRVVVYGVTNSLLGGTLTISIGYTDPQQAQTINVNLASATGSAARNQNGIYCTAGSAITLATSGYSSGTYSLYVYIEALG